MISSFRAEYGYLSNFYDSKITYNGITYHSSEAAFQAQKTKVLEIQLQFQSLTPGAAKRKGRKLYIRSDWDQVKDKFMYEIVKAKFEQNARIRRLLLDTGEEEMIEGTTWHDNYWGNCECGRCSNIEGKNKLGKILMRVRAELRSTQMQRETNLF